VGDDQIVLELGMQRAAGMDRTGQVVPQRMRAQQLVGIAAEAGGNAVDRLLAANLFGQEIGGTSRRE
jgi:hypothetical protein